MWDSFITLSGQPIVQVLALIAFAFVSEDAALIAAGLLWGHGALDPTVALLGGTLGIFISDLCCWVLGRFIGPRALKWSRLRSWLRVVDEEQIRSTRTWFSNHHAALIVGSRFLPGTRVAMQIAGGALNIRPKSFVLWTLVGAILWSPTLMFLVALGGEPAAAKFARWTGSAWIGLALGFIGCLLLLWITTKLIRAWQAGALVRLLHWEFWPAWMIYAPLAPWIALLSIRYRSVTLPTATNPGIPHSGVVGESKRDILARLPAKWVMPFARIEAGDASGRCRLLADCLADLHWSLPIILKPDAGQRGAGVRLIRNLAEAGDYFSRFPGPVLAQQYHPGPFEAGVFYYRIPGLPRGEILSVTDKRFPEVIGDGVNTIEHLIRAHSRLRLQAGVFSSRFGTGLSRIPAAGEVVRLAVAGNHCQGTMFRDGSHLITDSLRARFDEIASSFDGFYFGRFDVRYASPQTFMRGQDFRIVELNGLLSESTNMYDPGRSLAWAYGLLMRQWSIAYQIGAVNRQRGARVSGLAELFRETRAYFHAPQPAAISD